jgi:hypothetical protein
MSGGNVDFVDALLTETARSRGEGVVSFDRDFRKLGIEWSEPDQRAAMTRDSVEVSADQQARSPQVNPLVLVGDVEGTAAFGDGDALDAGQLWELADELAFKIARVKA